jgi:hypothetical protein
MGRGGFGFGGMMLGTWLVGVPVEHWDKANPYAADKKKCEIMWVYIPLYTLRCLYFR